MTLAKNLPRDGTSEFAEFYSEEIQLENTEERRYILGYFVTGSIDPTEYTVSIEYTHQLLPSQRGKFKNNNVIAINNPTYYKSLGADQLVLYHITSPYEVNTLDTTKWKLIPFDDDASVVWLFTESDSDSGEESNTSSTMSLLTPSAKVESVSLYAVYDMYISKLLEESETLLRERI